MENLKINLLIEEIEKFKLLSNYDTKKTLNENETPQDDIFGDLDNNTTPGILRGNSETKTGELNFVGTIGGVATYGVFKNKGFVPSLDKRKIIGVRTASKATRKGIQRPIETTDTNTPSGGNDVVSITIKSSVQNPFIFDTITLTDEANDLLTNFIEQLKELPTSYNSEIYSKYLEFLKSNKPIYINSYASKDGDPEEKISGKYAPCKNYGNKTRGDYDKCLSKKRAEYILERIEKEVPDFKGIFTPWGQGQTTKFNGKGWPNSKNTDETLPNRRFEINLPTFDYRKDTPKPKNGQVVNKPKTTVQNGKVYGGERTLVWNISEAFPSLPDGTTVKYKFDDNSGYLMVSLKELIAAFGSVGELKKNMVIINQGKFNDSQRVKTTIDQGGITITTQQGSFTWDNWSTSQASDYDVTSLLVTDYRPTAVKFNGEDLFITDLAFTLSIVPRKR